MNEAPLLRAALLAAVPADGSTIGNQSLLEVLRGQFPQVSEDEFWAVRDALIEAGELAKGRGRGGAASAAECGIAGVRRPL